MTNRLRIIVVGLAIVLVMALALYFVHRSVRNALDAAGRPVEKTIDLGSIVTQIRALNRLETASMEVMHVSTTRQSYQYVPDVVGGDELQFLAVGQVVAGVDLSLLRESDVRREGDVVTIDIPPPQLLLSRLDNRRSHVLNRQTGLLRKADQEMEGRARQEAEQAIRAEALKQGILNLAAKNADARLAELFHRAGVQRVVVRHVSSFRPDGRG